MSRSRYQFNVGDLVETRCVLSNGNGTIPAGTVMVVKGRFKGYALKMRDACTHCGVQMRIACVSEGSIQRHYEVAP